MQVDERSFSLFPLFGPYESWPLAPPFLVPLHLKSHKTYFVGKFPVLCLIRYIACLIKMETIFISIIWCRMGGGGGPIHTGRD